MFRRTVLLGVLLAVGTLALPSQAVFYQYNFRVMNFVNDLSGVNPATGETHLLMDVEEGVGGEILFTFRNTDPCGSGIDKIWFDDNVAGFTSNVLASYAVDGHVSVDGIAFSPPVTPGAPERGIFLAPDPLWLAAHTDYGVEAQADAWNRIQGPGESLTIQTTPNGTTLADVIDALDNGDLRVAVKVIFPDPECDIYPDYEEFIVSGPGTLIPEPATLLLGLLGGLGVMRRRRK